MYLPHGVDENKFIAISILIKRAETYARYINLYTQKYKQINAFVIVRNVFVSSHANVFISFHVTHHSYVVS